jgi:HK97 family phage major capsid protein
MDTSPDIEIKALLEQQGEAFASFKASVHERMDEIEAKANRLMLGGASSAPGAAASAAATKALATFVRKGDETELKAMSVGSDPDGGYLVTPSLSDAMVVKAFDQSPLGRLARRVQIGSGDALEVPIDADDIGAVWVGEATPRPPTDTAQLKLLRIAVHEIYSLQQISQRLLDDARFDVASWVSEKIRDKFARSFGQAFVTGDGVSRPRGLLTYPTSTAGDATRPWGTIQHVNTGHASGFIAPTTSASPLDCLIELSHSLRAPYRAGATWLMNRTTAGIVRGLKDGQGRHVWADPATGQPATLLGHPVLIDEEMPNVAAGAFPIAFGDFSQAYLIVERPGMRLLRDPYSSKPHVLLYSYSRVGGSVSNFEAVKLLRIAASG